MTQGFLGIFGFAALSAAPALRVANARLLSSLGVRIRRGIRGPRAIHVRGVLVADGEVLRPVPAGARAVRHVADRDPAELRLPRGSRMIPRSRVSEFVAASLRPCAGTLAWRLSSSSSDAWQVQRRPHETAFTSGVLDG